MALNHNNNNNTINNFLSRALKKKKDDDQSNRCIRSICPLNNLLINYYFIKIVQMHNETWNLYHKQYY